MKDLMTASQVWTQWLSLQGIEWEFYMDGDGVKVTDRRDMLIT